MSRSDLRGGYLREINLRGGNLREINLRCDWSGDR
ncbi:MAG: hypothetical protein ACFCA4_07300 [Cyanophyceae cyanobacterium]